MTLQQLSCDLGENRAILLFCSATKSSKTENMLDLVNNQIAEHKQMMRSYAPSKPQVPNDSAWD